MNCLWTRLECVFFGIVVLGVLWNSKVLHNLKNKQHLHVVGIWIKRSHISALLHMGYYHSLAPNFKNILAGNWSHWKLCCFVATSAQSELLVASISLHLFGTNYSSGKSFRPNRDQDAKCNSIFGTTRYTMYTDFPPHTLIKWIPITSY